MLASSALHRWHAGVVFIILALNEKRSVRLKLFYILAGVLGLYGLMISGTRGAIAVPAMGFALYIILRKNFKVMLIGANSGYRNPGVFLNTQQSLRAITLCEECGPHLIQPKMPHTQVRMANRNKLSAYMASRPFGGGIGSAGNWGLRFTPNSFLANTPTDGWYVMIWAEQGIVGLYLHLFILFYILFKSIYIIMFKLKDEEIKAIMSALVSGFFGIMVASYGNGILGQMPTGILIYSSMAFLFLAPKLEKEKQESLKNTMKI